VLSPAGEPVTLAYDVYCTGNDDPEAPCDVGGTVYFHAGSAGAFQTLPLQVDTSVGSGRLVASLPAPPSGGYSYYAFLQNTDTGEAITLPAAGANAPDRILPLGAGAVPIDLGTHAFGVPAQADARVASAAWGEGATRVGLEDASPAATPIGASSFDVDAAGNVSVLDEAHRRILRFPAGGGAPTELPLTINGTIADLALAPDGSIAVLESASDGVSKPLLRSFDAAGNENAEVPISGRTASQVRATNDGALALQYPSAQWMPMTVGGLVLDGAQQETAGSVAGSASADGTQVLELRLGNELRVATLGSGVLKRSWRMTSATPLAEVQLAQPLGKKVVVVVRTYTDTQAEFQVLVLNSSGVLKQFAVPAADWAETAPLSRFRLVGSSLYQLGSTPSGVFVDRYDLGVS